MMIKNKWTSLRLIISISKGKFYRHLISIHLDINIHFFKQTKLLFHFFSPLLSDFSIKET